MTASRSAVLGGLIERVREATTGSPALDREVVGAALDLEWRPYRPGARKQWGYRRGAVLAEVYEPKPYSTSIDAALALVERCLPGWTTGDHTADGSPETYPIAKGLIDHGDGLCEAVLAYQHPKIESRVVGEGGAPTLPLAICLALLLALQAQEGGE